MEKTMDRSIFYSRKNLATCGKQEYCTRKLHLKMAGVKVPFKIKNPDNSFVGQPYDYE